MTTTFMPSFKTLEELQAHQLKGLQWTVNHAYQGSPFYRRKFDEAGIKPEDFRSLEDVSRLPFLHRTFRTVSLPFAVPLEQVVHSASAGTNSANHNARKIDDWITFCRC
jgi:phenylacetate-CoA ligase